MSADTIVHSARLVSGGRLERDAWVAFAGEGVLARGTGDGWRGEAAPASAIVDAGGAFLTPGFVDLHGHGGGGASFDDGGAAIDLALATHRAHGTTRSVLSLVTAPVEALEARLAEIADRAADDPLVLGAHLEGPFLAPEFKGAHTPSLLRAPDAGSVERLLLAGGGALRQITIAPELPGADVAVGRFVDAGVRVAVGHTATDFDGAARAFDAGASILTHAFNAMHPIHHRAPGPVVAAMQAGHVTLEVIADGVHLHPGVVRLAFDGAAGRAALVTDAMAAAGAADGDYLLGGLAVSVDDGVARLADGTIAGSTLTLDLAIRVAVASGVALEQAVLAATGTPADAIGRPDLGRLEAGCAADAVLLDDGLEVRGVWAAGRRLI
ncbi:N-acetylglucosamine-6-phosphate deacetylase [Agromyces seonyuensis]|uniref:Amidohydrolase family protein n=1 Tax=Agromyces seonyuensis TaxID=2662446 RepID=A0A6I4P0L2_9MICO|nr:amidohydrolase family protein [Agromyces seonyuensis]MWC00184.1 amidohydrolase family protein [Agromyces seonyuensis]